MSEKSRVVFRDRIDGIGFSTIPVLVMRDSRLLPAAKIIYGFLRSYARQDEFCFPGVLRLSEDSSIGDKGVRRALKSLESIGLVNIMVRGQGRTNIYYLEPLRDVYAVNDSDELSQETLKSCRLDGSGDPSEVQETPPSEPVRVDTGAAAAHGVIEATKKKSAGAHERTKQKREHKEKMRQALGDTSRAEARSFTRRDVELASDGDYNPSRLRAIWEQTMKECFPEQVPLRTWSVKERSFVKSMVKETNQESVEKILEFVPRHWSAYQNRYAKQSYAKGPPTIGFIYAYRATIIGEAQQGFLQEPGKEGLQDDEYQHGTEHLGDGRAF